MKNNLYFILAGICIFTHIVRTIYEILKHRKRVVPDKHLVCDCFYEYDRTLDFLVPALQYGSLLPGVANCYKLSWIDACGFGSPDVPDCFVDDQIA